MTPSLTRTLFDRFTEIWGAKWTAIELRQSKTIAKVWLDALRDVDVNSIKIALDKIKQDKINWPLSPVDFLKLCDPEIKKNIGFDFAFGKAEDIVKRKIKIKNPRDLLIERQILVDLHSRIYNTQSISFDFIFCGTDGCSNYKIVPDNFLELWFCDRHKK